MSETTDWASGQECKAHYLAWCTDCRDLAGMRRNAAGETVYKGDCTVATLREITGADYDEAAAVMAAAGFRPGRGAYAEETRQAFESLGYHVQEIWRDLDWAVMASQQGRCFWVSAHKSGRGKGHSWSIVDGTPNRPWWPPYRFRLFEITA